MKTITRKSLLYKTAVEYGDYTINHVQGCSHGCKYPCYAYLMARRFGRAANYDEWCQPYLVENAEALLEKELPRMRSKIKSVHLCFTTDPFMYGYQEISDMSVRLIKKINDAGIPCTALTKGILPDSLCETDHSNSYGITLISLNEEFRQRFEPGSAPYEERITSLEKLHRAGYKTWVSIEPYPTPNIIEQSFYDILGRVSFADKLIFGRLNYNALVTNYEGYQAFFNNLSQQFTAFCIAHNQDYHIKDGTLK